MLDADFQVFEHSETGQHFVRTLSYSIPEELQGHLDLVHPTITYVPIFLPLLLFVLHDFGPAFLILTSNLGSVYLDCV